jgi:mannose-6-phosphate isomerase-like protein (cupin superfamily)
MTRILKKSLDTSPDETQKFDRGKMDLAKFGEATIGRVILQPGWSWEKSMKPIQNTETCQSPPHIQYIISGRIGVSLEDGTEEELGPGDVAMIPPGHKTWVVGNEPVVGIDFSNPNGYSKSTNSV